MSGPAGGLPDTLLAGERRLSGAVRERDAHRVRLGPVAQIGSTGWTKDGLPRHPHFPGLRDDKGAGAVVRERPGRHVPR
ncbi:hypothetical protein ACFVHS_39075 [Streptomyces sp. NPDC057746]|uniref:hypothetical protein n=1 Tax=Streptomyces sp. NPDC057746 TaxID=3346237 RepID=UPI0036A65427